MLYARGQAACLLGRRDGLFGPNGVLSDAGQPRADSTSRAESSAENIKESLSFFIISEAILVAFCIVF